MSSDQNGIWRPESQFDICCQNRRVADTLMAAALCLICPATDERHQIILPERGGIILDVFMDAVGTVLVGVYLDRDRRKSARP